MLGISSAFFDRNDPPQHTVRIFLYEYVTGGGCLSGDADLFHALLREGRAMVTALATDLARVDRCQVVMMRDARATLEIPPEIEQVVVDSKDLEKGTFQRLARTCDASLIIAPESGGVLGDRLRQVEAVGGRLLCPSGPFVDIASDKLKTTHHLESAGILTPATIPIAGREAPSTFRFPGVLKPRDGAGSQGVRKVAGPDELRREIEAVEPDQPQILSLFCPGKAISVAVLNGLSATIYLPACRQRFEEEGQFEYLGGAFPLSPPLETRARRLAVQVVQAMPSTLGYFGIDMVLGEQVDGSEDRVIEINPRLTTSYLGLRVACRENLAEAWLALAKGERFALSFRRQPITFDADGSVHPSL